jgi:hypothetical protein
MNDHPLNGRFVLKRPDMNVYISTAIFPPRLCGWTNEISQAQVFEHITEATTAAYYIKKYAWNIMVADLDNDLAIVEHELPINQELSVPSERQTQAIYSFWENRVDKACFISSMEDNGFLKNLAPEPEPTDPSEEYNAALNFAIEEADGAQDAMDFLVAWREGDWGTIDEHYPEFDLSNRLRNAQL